MGQQWRSYAEYVDRDTGELLKVGDKKRFLKEYQIINRIKQTDYENRIIKYTNECRRIERQQEISFDYY